MHEVVEAVDGASRPEVREDRNLRLRFIGFPTAGHRRVRSARRSNFARRRQPGAVLILTGESDHDVALRLMRAGALDYLTKTDANPSSLARAIRYAKARQRSSPNLKRPGRKPKRSLALSISLIVKRLLAIDHRSRSAQSFSSGSRFVENSEPSGGNQGFDINRTSGPGDWRGR